MATNSAYYCMLFSEWASSKLIRLEVDIGSVPESEFGPKWRYGVLCILKVLSSKKKCLKSFKTLVTPLNSFLETIAMNPM